MLKLSPLIFLFLLIGCGQQQETENPPLTPAAYLAREDTAGFLRATDPRTFIFPEDHGRHPGYRNEWWYFTGNLETGAGRRFGYQVTFFSIAVRPDEDNDCEGVSGWCSNHIWMGHAAVSDIAKGEHHKAEIFSREDPGLAGTNSNPFRVWIQDWQLFSTGRDFPWELEVLTDDFALSLNLVAEKYPVLQGDAGLSRKSGEPGNASYYYSITRIATTGQIHLAGESYEISGDSWMDREWGTSALAPDQSGWDWFSLQLNDGSELMYYQLRDENGEEHPYSQGSLTSLMGTRTTISPDKMTLTEKVNRLAHNGISYTTEWEMQYGGKDWIIRAVFPDQLMEVTFQYWEGAVDVLDAATEEKVGQGYLEMVR